MMYSNLYPSIARYSKMVATMVVVMVGSGTHIFGDITGCGSDSTFQLVKALADAYSEESGHVISLSGGGSSHGAKACLEGEVEFGFLSRKLKFSEAENGLTGFSYAKDGVAIVVHPKNPTDDISIEMLAQLYAGETTWENGKPAVLFNRNADSGTREVFEKTVLGDRSFSDDAKISHDQLMLRQVSRIPTAIGYTSAFHVGKTVKVLQVEGTLPSQDAILTGEYPISRTLTLAVPENVKPSVKAFVDFVLSSKGAAIITEQGYLPLTQ